MRTRWNRRIGALVPLIGFAFALGPSQARATDEGASFLLKVEHLEIQPYFARLAKVKAYVNLVAIEGAPVNVAPADLALVVDGSPRKEIAGGIAFEATHEPLDLVVVVETGVRFASAISSDDGTPTLEEPLYQLLAKQPKNVRASLVTYGGDRAKATPLDDPSKAARAWKRIVPEDEPEAPHLIDAMKLAIKTLKNAPPPQTGRVARRVILVISDGVNDDEPQGEDLYAEFRKVIKSAADADIAVHALAFSIGTNREPFRNLAQMAKKTHGVFRMAESRADFQPHLDSFAASIARQLVLTYLLPPDAIIGKSFKLRCKSAICGQGAVVESLERKAPSAQCGTVECGLAQACIQGGCVSIAMTSGTGGHTGPFVFGAAGLLVAGGGIWAALRLRARRSRKKTAAKTEVAAAEVQAQAAIAAANIVIPDFSNMPYLANNPQVMAQMEEMRRRALMQAGVQSQPAQPVAPRAVAPSPASRHSLLILNGPRQGQTLPLRHGFTVGKQQGCDLVVDDGYTSGHHAQFHLDTAGGCTVVDLGSTNGIFVNGVRTKQQRLSHGMSVRVGQTDIRFLQG